MIDLMVGHDLGLEFCRDFGVGTISEFIGIDGRPFGLIANSFCRS